MLGQLRPGAGAWCARAGTCRAVVAAHAELVQAPAVLHRELVVVGEGGLLGIAQVHAQLVAALGRDPVYVVQPCGGEQRLQEPGLAAWGMGAGMGLGPLRYVPGRKRGIGDSDAQTDGLLSDTPARTPNQPLRRTGQVYGGVPGAGQLGVWPGVWGALSLSILAPSLPPFSNLVWVTVAGAAQGPSALA